LSGQEEFFVRKLVKRVALVTGGSRGIGAAIAYALAAEGANVGINYVRRQREAEKICEDVQDKFGVEAMALKADVSVPGEVQGMVDTMLKKFARIDILVNNAGVLIFEKLVDTPLEHWNAILNTNLTGVFLCTKAVLPSMLKHREGRIISIASDSAQMGDPGLVAYTAAKGGVIAFTKSLAREVAREGVLVNCIAPGPIETDMVKGVSKESKKAKGNSIPIGRFGRPEEVAASVVFLASSDSSYFVGQTLGPNGGDAML
jgi:3-oxoacyl-[acyl-carrier protein] reductase